MDAPDKTRVLIVDDSAFMRMFFENLLSSFPDIEVAGKARNGVDALQKIKRLKPDVVTLDVEMPQLDGLSALRKIMSTCPLPVIMVSTLTSSSADITMECLEEGALDFVQKPASRNPRELKAIGNDLVTKIRLAAHSRTKILRIGDHVPIKEDFHVKRTEETMTCRQDGNPDLLLIAASTGGPQALSRLLPCLPGDFPVPVAMVQHMPAGFTKSFTRRLNGLSPLSVREAEEGMPLVPGTAILAPGGRHLLIKKNEKGFFCSLSDLPPVNSVRPAADTLFSSVALLDCVRTVTVILTGMGKDGAAGAKILREKGSVIMAESKESAIIYGMPKAVVDAGIADVLLPLDRLPAEIKRLFGIETEIKADNSDSKPETGKGISQ
jgi:two-component system chemotaxis response regulator CheB